MEEVFEDVKEWAETAEPEAAGTIEDVRIVFLAGIPSEEGYYPNVTVIVYPKPILALTLDALVQAETLWGKENLQQYHEYSQVKTTVDGREAITIDMKNYEPGMGTWRCFQLYTIKDNLVWVVTTSCFLEDFGYYKDTFDQIIRSLRILR